MLVCLDKGAVMFGDEQNMSHMRSVEMLWECGVPGPLLNSIQSLYYKCKSCVYILSTILS